ncbi:MULTISPECIES: DUF1048 domain-containing protein [Gordonibacter]|uniref:DUF1048 domain-containing protein n=1 Tax=Gordonibacter faecis TaxID=3047475 RepID=A0ABT7DQH5_9ACTN|nr:MULTISPECIES: DUF1048 domain-containing protein [unclassified Gordonibacter]MDJ1651788.1 DUF1048 domain-containing protein [Gordonibacter sp. KGMB12511]HIW75679.1 DUF1048 domain-containing protein [Candidatus Gordonibacter avicola]
MNFWDRVTGNDMDRDLAGFAARAAELPPAYQAAWKEITERLWNHADFTGRNLMPIFDGVLGLLEEAAADNRPVETVLGTNVADFCAELASAEGAQSLRDRWRDQLNASIARKLNQQGE